MHSLLKNMILLKIIILLNIYKHTRHVHTRVYIHFLFNLKFSLIKYNEHPFRSVVINLTHTFLKFENDILTLNLGSHKPFHNSYIHEDIRETVPFICGQ